MTKDNKYFGDIVLIISSLLWGVGYVAVTYALMAGTGELFLTASRFVLATIIQLPFVYKKLRNADKYVIRKGILLGTLLVGGFFAQTIGQSYTTTTNVAFLTSVNVVLIPFTSLIFIRKKIAFRSVIAAFITFIGIGFLTLGNTFHINLGDYYVLICALLFAIYASFTDRYVKKEDPSLLVFFQIVTAAALSTIAFMFSSEKVVINMTNAIWIIYLALFSNLIASFLYSIGLRYTSAERGSVIVSIESIFGTMFGILLFNDPFNYRMIIGAALIIFAILYSEKVILNGKRKNRVNSGLDIQ